MLKLETGKDNRILRVASREVADFSDANLKPLIAEMMKTLQAIPNGVGLAAPQIGKNIRLFVVSPKLKAPTVFINPEILKRSQGHAALEESCLSLPELFGVVKRSKWVKVKAQDEFGKKFTLRAEGLLAQLLQHEIGHLNGELYVDKAIKLFEVKNGKARELYVI